MCWTSADKRTARVVALDAATYRPHALHGAERTWTETNCYSDLVIEMLHGLGRDPMAVLPYTLAIDFEGDQWTFFKPPHSDLAALYAIDIQELAIWRPLAQQVRDQVAAGRIVLVELDSYFLPDTAGTAYRREHNKTAVGVNEIDLESRHLGYFHNNGYFTLDGEDFDAVLQVAGPPSQRVLPPFVEIAKIRTDLPVPQERERVEASLALLRGHLARAPRVNPFARFKAKFTLDLDVLKQADIEQFHRYSFANLRQYGACFELAESYLGWLGAHGVEGLAPAREAFYGISTAAKALQFQLARSMSRGKALDLAPLDAMGARWDVAMSLLRERYA